MLKYHVMADIETLGTGNNALPITISAVKFTRNDILSKFEVGVDPEDAQRYGRVITGGTVLYWLDEKRAEARKRLLEIPRIDLASALQGFADWCRIAQEPVEPSRSDPFGENYAGEIGSLWGKGATFDNIILRSAAEATQTEWPFSFRQDECYRTLANRCPDIEYVQRGVAHVGVDDALSQALHLQRIAVAKGLTL